MGSLRVVQPDLLEHFQSTAPRHGNIRYDDIPLLADHFF